MKCLLFMLLLLLLPGLSVGWAATTAQSETARLAQQTVQQSAKGSSSGDFLLELRNSGSGGFYNEVLSFAQDQANKNLNTALQNGREATALAGQVKSIRDKIAKVNQVVGRLLAVVDVTNKLAAEDGEGAAWSAGFTILGELAGKESVVKALGLTSTAPITAAIVALQVYKASWDAKEKAARDTGMESMYGTVEIIVRNRNRELGEAPGPFPATSENIEKVWQKILASPDFRNSFGNYVVQKLGGQWPQPGFFSRMDASYVGLTTTTAENLQSQREELEKNKSDIQRYIASLLASLNNAAKVEEQRMLAVIALRNLQNYFAQHGATLEAGLKNMERASGRISEMKQYAAACEANIRQYIKEKSLDSLTAQRFMIVMYVRDVLRWLPPAGADQGLDAIFNQLQSGYQLASDEIDKLRLEYDKKNSDPEPPFLTAPDAPGLYLQFFKDEIKPFEWDNSGGPDTVIGQMQRVLAAGQFRSTFDKTELPAGRTDLAGSVIRAWSVENFAVAAAGGTTGTVSAPGEDEKERTIDGYYEDVRKKLAKIYQQGPGGPVVGDNWKGAWQLANDALGRLSGVTRLEYRETAESLTNMLSVYQAKAQQLHVRAREIDGWFVQFGAQAFSPEFLGVSRPTTGFAGGTLPQSGEDDPLAIVALIASLDQQHANFQLSPIAASTDDYPGPTGGITQSLHDHSSRLFGIGQSIEFSYSPYLDKIESLTLDMEQLGKRWDEAFKEAQADLEDIRLFVDPDFMDSPLFQSWQTRRKKVPDWVNYQTRLARELTERIERYSTEQRETARYLDVIRRNIEQWLREAVNQEIMQDHGSGMGNLKTGYNFSGSDPFVKWKPYLHYLTRAEKQRLKTESLTLWKGSGLEKFCASYAEWLQAKVDAYWQEYDQLPTLNTDNFLVGEVAATSRSYSPQAVTAEVLNQAEQLSSRMVPGREDFEALYGQMRSLLPLEISFPLQPDKETFRPLADVTLRAPLAGRYVALRDALKQKLALHYPLREQRLAEQRRQQNNLASQKLPGLLGQLRGKISSGRRLVKDAEMLAGRGPQLDSLLVSLKEAEGQLFEAPYPETRDLYLPLVNTGAYQALVLQVQETFREMEHLLADLRQTFGRLEKQKDDLRPEVERFYAVFIQNYQQKNVSGLLAALDDHWEAGDGTTLWDVEAYFHNMFNVFDDIEFRISNLSLEKLSGSRYLASYETVITGHIYADDLEHVEKSVVSEELDISATGKIRIMRTPQGRLWFLN